MRFFYPVQSTISPGLRFQSSQESTNRADKAVENNNISLLKKLIAEKHDLNEVADIRFTTPLSGKTRTLRSAVPLHITGISGSVEMAKRLVENGADTNAQTTNREWTALHYATKYKHPDTVDFLLSKNADTGITDKRGR